MGDTVRVLVVHDHLGPVGGGGAVAAWALQALRSCSDLSLLTRDPFDQAAVNRFYAATLATRETDWPRGAGAVPWSVSTGG